MDALPLLMLAVTCFALSFLSHAAGTPFGAGRYPIWLLFIALGIIATAGGIGILAAAPDEEDRPGPTPEVPAGVPLAALFSRSSSPDPIRRSRRPASAPPTMYGGLAGVPLSAMPVTGGPRRADEPGWADLEALLDALPEPARGGGTPGARNEESDHEIEIRLMIEEIDSIVQAVRDEASGSGPARRSSAAGAI